MLTPSDTVAARLPVDVQVRMMEQALEADASKEALLIRRQTLQHECEARGIEWARPMTWREILQMVAEANHVTVDDLTGQRRAREFSWPRQEAMWLLRQQRRPNGAHRFSLPQIGRMLGGRDHTTVLHGVRRHEQRLAVADVYDRG